MRFKGVMIVVLYKNTKFMKISYLDDKEKHLATKRVKRQWTKIS